MKNKLTVLCLASFEKGADFMKQCKEEGCKVILVTSKSLENSDYWPRDFIDEIFYMPDINKEWKLNDLIYGVSYLARTETIDRIVALDDFDVEKGASLREHLRIGGMGDTTARYFRDKLAMRVKAKSIKLPVPEFIHILNYREINEFLNKVEPPYVIKPRLQAGAVGIKKVYDKADFWKVVDSLGDEQSFYLAEKFIPGEIFHVDTIMMGKEVLFSIVNKYGLPPMEVSHEGRVFSSSTVLRGSEDEIRLQELNKKVLKGLGLVQGISHSEYIKSNETGNFYFLETSARVGGANVAELVEAASGINLWREWAKMETMENPENYCPPVPENNYAALMLSLAKQEYPDMSSYDAPEIWWKLKKKYHAGLIIKSNLKSRVDELLEEYTFKFYNDFFIAHPPTDKVIN